MRDSHIFYDGQRMRPMLLKLSKCLNRVKMRWSVNGFCLGTVVSQVPMVTARPIRIEYSKYLTWWTLVFCKVDNINSNDITKASRTIELTCIGASASVVPPSEHDSPLFATRCWSRLGLTQDQFLVVPPTKKSIFLKMCSRVILLFFCVDSKSD